jgi:L-ascorbate metabolism protein UlaG (beta-lactamase superfamily)
VLIVPVTGPPGITPEGAVELVNVLEPALVIPVHGVGQGRLAQFLREMAAEETEPVNVLAVSSLRLPDQPEVRVLVPKTLE